MERAYENPDPHATNSANAGTDPRLYYAPREEKALTPTLAIAALWGFAEATLFFIVPDVFLTLVALDDRRAALRACAAATGGALAGGLLMYLWAARDPARALSALLSVPAIHAGMLARVRESLNSSGAVALFLGPLTGTPYKIYAVESGESGVSLLLFLAVSIPARGLRFLILALAVDRASRGPLAPWPLACKRALVAGLWALFYVAYFSWR